MPMCAHLTGLDVAALTECAEGERGRALQAASYARTATRAPPSAGFAPVFVAGGRLEGVDEFWRKTPDQLKWGGGVLRAVCSWLPAPPMPACANVSVSESEQRARRTSDGGDG